MRAALLAPSITGSTTTKPCLVKHAVPVPGAVAVAVRPGNQFGQSQTLVVCHHGLCPLYLSDNLDEIYLGAPLAVRNHVATQFNVRQVYDAAFDPFSNLLILASGTRLLGLDSGNRLEQIAGDEVGGLLYDGHALQDARFVGAQRLAPDGRGVTYIRDRDSSSLNGFCLRALYETPMPDDAATTTTTSNATSSSTTRVGLRGFRTGSGHRAVVTVQTGGDTAPHILTYDQRRRSLLVVRRGRAIHRLLPLGVTEELVGTDEPPAYNAAASAAAAAASASDASDSDPESAGGGAGGTANTFNNTATVAVAEDKIFTNIQALAADPASGNVYILDGTSGSTTSLRVLRPDGGLDTLEARLRVGPNGSARWPRLAVLPEGYLAVFGTSQHDMLLVKP